MEVSGGSREKLRYFGLWIRRSLVRDQEVVPLLSIGYLVSVEVQKPPSRHIVDN